MVKGTKNFSVGDKIFAKVKGFVYWPARVNSLPPDVKIPSNKIPIFFYGTHEVYFISPNSCWMYDEKTKTKWGKPKTRAHFNQGMDEIENNPTILEYGKDPKAESFLCQFYEFTKENGEFNKLLTEEETTRSRHKSGTSENTMSSKGVKSEKDTKSQKESRKRKLDTEDEENEDVSGSESPSVASDNPQDEDFKPAAKKSKTASGAVPAAKPKTPKVTKPKVEKTASKPKVSRKPKAPQSKSAAKVKSNDDLSELESLSSMSSIENWKAKDEKEKKDLEEQVKKKQLEQVKKEEEAVKEAKKITRERKKSEIKDESDKNEETQQPSKDETKRSTRKERNSIKKENKPMPKMDKEIVVKLTKTEIPISKENKTENIEESDAPYGEKDIVRKEENKEIIDSVKEQVTVESIKETDNEMAKSKVESGDQTLNNPENEEIKKFENIDEINEDKKEDHSEKVEIFRGSASPKEKDIEEDSNVSEKSLKQKLLLISDSEESIETELPPKKKKTIAKKQSKEPIKQSIKQTDDKRVSKTRKKLLDSDSESEDEVVAKKSKKSSMEPKKPQNGSFVERKKSPNPQISQVEILINFNNDIRQNLVLNNENYDNCLKTFRSIMDMDIDIISLVKATQLTETIKKCRKYKRNDQIKIEAQNVYSKFMKIYSDAGPEKIKEAQTLINEKKVQKNQKDDHLNDVIVIESVQNTDKVPLNQETNNENESRVESKDNGDEPKLVIEESVNVPEPVVEVVKETEEERLQRLNEELDAKANAILYKIEKNAPTNLKTLSHLLPHENTQITFPTEWQTTKKVSGKKDDKESDDDDDDEEIFRRIEQVPIKQTEMDEVENVTPRVAQTTISASSSSTLDARIASMINDSNNVSSQSKDSRSKKQRNVRNDKGKSSTTSNIPLSPKSSGNKMSLEPTYKHIPTKVITPESKAPNTTPSKKEDDSDIYDLLGV